MQTTKEKATDQKTYWYRESTSVYNPAFIIENKEGETMIQIYQDSFPSSMAAEKVTKKIVALLNKIN